MKKEDLENRISEIAKAAEQGLANYHALIGRLNEAKYILEEFQKGEYLKAAENATELVEEVANG